ncbi:site-specific DNA-methyltransferase [Neogemmobacter tilapiae]|uniref:site-specific DNA-methyltransferase (adenine-specific) n=1 Tax=Neogemmobacter tilapiae TaxID=875041 RepID=A0A918TRT7_9RHOB|nr:DNA methyltransferase [Gemmobacter tilapiae]GHC60588.1 methyltransferase [Gemmobacter tilapiae]
MTQTIEMIPPASLRPWATNARTHSKKQLKQIAASIETFGFTNPVLIDQSNTILAGHGRVEAAKHLGLTEVPCVRIEHMSEAEKRAYVIADNKLALNAGWDEELLAQELQGLLATENIGFDIGVIGFEVAEIDALVEGLTPEEPGDPEDDILPEFAPRRVHAGDIWQLGTHRLICGDALDAGIVAAVMEGDQARMVFSDPPYNVKIDGHVGGSGKVKHREFAMAAGEMTMSEFTAFLTRALQNMANHSVDGSIHFHCMDWRHMGEMLAAGHAVYDELKNLIVWAKDNGGMGTFYRSRHELIFAFKKGTAPHVNSFELGQHGRYRTNVWNYRGVNSMRKGRMDELRLHPTVKPVQMIADAIRDVSGRGEIVLDVFGGSGSTLIAAEKTGRRARLVELDPIYCDRILTRWEIQAKDMAEQLVCGWPRAASVAEAVA